MEQSSAVHNLCLTSRLSYTDHGMDSIAEVFAYMRRKEKPIAVPIEPVTPRLARKPAVLLVPRRLVNGTVRTAKAEPVTNGGTGQVMLPCIHRSPTLVFKGD